MRDLHVVTRYEAAALDERAAAARLRYQSDRVPPVVVVLLENEKQLALRNAQLVRVGRTVVVDGHHLYAQSSKT